MIKTIIVSSAVLIISAYLLANFIFKKISGELKCLNDALENIGKGNLTVTIPGNNIKEINEALQMFIERTREDIASLKDIQGEIKYLVDKAGDIQDKKPFLRLWKTQAKNLYKTCLPAGLKWNKAILPISSRLICSGSLC